jgi:hypothetical protein
MPAGKNRRPEALKNPTDASFAGRPFPLEEGEAHFDLLARRGFTFIRFIITWEALEHAGPGIYDEEYLAYLRKILLMAEKKGISVFIDPHQDVWSRWTGGDGAPAWTLEKLGFDLDKLDATGAAVTWQRYGEFHPTPYPRMMWPVNYNRYAGATLFTLFFGGNAYAPETRIEGESAQDWLQERYLAAMRHCYRRLKNCAAIKGWGTMNEPHPGFIGYKDLEGLENYAVALGPMPSPFQAMAAASGHSVSAPVYVTGLRGERIIRREVLNPHGLSLFKEGFCCPWKQAGVWTDEGGSPRLLRQDYFACFNGGPAHFAGDFLKPFMLRFMERIKEAGRQVLFFIEGVPPGRKPGEDPPWEAGEVSGVVNAFHRYDGLTLFTKSFRSWFTVDAETGRFIPGRKNTAAYFSQALAQNIARTRRYMGNMPCFLGEFGLPFDMNRGRAFKTGDYRLHEEALSMYYDGIDENLLHSAIWNYTADNTHERGDGWNDEDLSIFSGGLERAQRGWCRPYPMATAGRPCFLKWDRKRGVLNYRFQADPSVKAPTEIYAPQEWFGQDPEITIRPGNKEGLRGEYKAPEGRFFILNDGYEGDAELVIRADKVNPGVWRA